ncbi:MAG: aldolase catalytic domain-containing protein [Oscillospiraceae bacterium]|nr:aldolase catalytic domain-containing protein [Oscillospiraceae bacterium]
MGNIALLDCTLRDGGYVNDWKFGNINLISIFERLVDSGVDIIEVGFLDERRPFDKDRSIMPDSRSAGRIWGGLDKKGATVVGMIDYGTCGIEHLEPASESFLDGIRVIFKKHLMHEAMDYCAKVKALGYKVFSQLVSITAYNDEELKELAELVNDVKPYAVSIVDTYGLLHPDDLLHYYEVLDENVDKNVSIGFHAHNNFQLAYANGLAFMGRETDRDILVDGTLFGMGKSAGNAPLELLAMRLNSNYGKNYNIDSMLECIEESVMEFYAVSPWGYKSFFYLCAKNRCHPNYLTYFRGKQNLSTTQIDKLLAQISPEDKKLLYDKLLAEKLYDEQADSIVPEKQSIEAFKKEIGDRPVLIIGPGKNIRLQEEKVSAFIRSNSPYVVSINYIPKNIDVHCVFVTNAKRYHDMTLTLKESNAKVLATSNVESRTTVFDFVVNRAPLLEQDEKIMDNSFLMLVKFLSGLGLTEINCAGFDGYSDREDNYCDPAMEYGFIKQESSHLNSHMKKRIAEFRKVMTINFITYSAYDEEEDINSAAI